MLLLWIALTNGLTNALTGLIIGMFMYYYGKRQGEKSKEVLKEEIQAYIKGELFTDLKGAIQKEVSDTTKGIFGPFAKSVNGEVPEVARQWANENPGIMSMLLGVGKAAAVNKAAKMLGVPKEVKDYLKMAAQGMVLPQGPPPEQVQNQPIVTQGNLYR